MNREHESLKSIDDLPVEVLEEVFLGLDVKSLKNCCLVKKKWNNVIGQSSSLMEKLPLKLNLYETTWSKAFKDTTNFNRKYNTIHILIGISEHKWDEYAIKTLNRFGAECHHIKFVGRCGKRFSVITKISLESIKFPLLKSAEITCATEGFASEIIRVLSSSQLSHLSFEGYSTSDLITFLSTQTKLTKLSLDYWYAIPFGCLRVIERIQTPLKTLSLHGTTTSEDTEKLVAFLSRFTESLEDLTLGYHEKCNLIYELIFTKFNKLKSLAARINRAPQEISFYNKLRPNYCVKKFVVGDSYSNNQEIFNRFIGLMPNVETLELDLPNDTLLFVSNHLKRLTTLELNSVNSQSVVKFAHVCLPKVKTIVFGQISNVRHEQWKLIIDAFPNVESMSVKFFCEASSLDGRSIKIIAENWPNLVFLKFGKGFVAHDQIFVVILRNCKEIKTVKLTESSFKSKKSRAKIFKRLKEHEVHLIVDKSPVKSMFERFKGRADGRIVCSMRWFDFD